MYLSLIHSYASNHPLKKLPQVKFLLSSTAKAHEGRENPLLTLKRNWGIDKYSLGQGSEACQENNYHLILH